MTTVILRPNATVVAATSLTGGASTHAVTSDDSDASYATHAANVTGFTVDLTTFTIPAGAFVKTANIRLRVRGTPGNNVSANWAGPGGYGASYGGGSGQPAAFTTISMATWAYGSGSNGLSQANIDSLGVYVFAFPTTAVDVAEIYVDVVYATQPVTVVTAPTGTVTTTTNPTVTWTHTQGSDGGPQTSYQLKVFSAAQYGAGGFSPDTSPSVFDAGTVLGNASSQVVGPLPDGAYRVYVRTAQSINLNWPHWAEWAFVAFSMVVAGPIVSSVAATADNANGRTRVTVTRDTGSPVWTTLDLERSDDGGVTWVQVRGATGVVPPGDVWIGYDYEAPPDVSVRYRARGNSTAGGLVYGAWKESASTVTWTTSQFWLKSLLDTTQSMVVMIHDLSPLDRPVRQGVFQPLGRTTPVIVSDVRQSIVGRIDLYTITDEQADDLLALVQSSDVLLLQIPARYRFGSRYLAIGTLTEARPGPGYEPMRIWTLPFVEVDQPADEGLALTSFGLTWQDVINTYATWTAVGAANATWGDLL